MDARDFARIKANLRELPLPDLVAMRDAISEEIARRSPHDRKLRPVK